VSHRVHRCSRRIPRQSEKWVSSPTSERASAPSVTQITFAATNSNLAMPRYVSTIELLQGVKLFSQSQKVDLKS
jgi:hypothetical protein